MENTIRTLFSNLENVLRNVHQNIGQEDFVTKPGKYLGSAINIYVDFLKQNNFTSFNEFLEVITREGQKNMKLQEIVERLWELEETWDGTLKTAIKNKVFFEVQFSINISRIIAKYSQYPRNLI